MGSREKKWRVVSISEPQLQSGLMVSKNYGWIYDNADNWDLVATLSRVCGLWEFKTLFGNGLMNLKIRFLNILLSNYWMSMSSLLYSSVLFLNSCWKVAVLEEILFSAQERNVIWPLNWARCIFPGDHVLCKKGSFLGHLLFWRDSRPSLL